MNPAFLASLACPDLNAEQLSRLAASIECDRLLASLTAQDDHQIPAPNQDELDFYARYSTDERKHNVRK